MDIYASKEMRRWGRTGRKIRWAKYRISAEGLRPSDELRCRNARKKYNIPKHRMNFKKDEQSVKCRNAMDRIAKKSMSHGIVCANGYDGEIMTEGESHSAAPEMGKHFAQKIPSRRSRAM